jgi:hypothetical protein
VVKNHLGQWTMVVQVSIILDYLMIVVQSRICRVDVKYPEHVSAEAKSFMSKVHTPSYQSDNTATSLQPFLSPRSR